MNKIKVLLVEDDPVWRDGLAAYIEREPDIVLIGSAANKEDAIQLAKLVDMDVVLMDIVLSEPNLDGLEAAIEILAFKKTKMIMLTSVSENEVILNAFAAGVVNYITKSNFKEIPFAIRAAYHNQSAIHPDAAEALRNEFSRMKKEEQKRMLTHAEKEVLELIYQGNTQPQIQKLLHIAESTLKKHAYHIMKKLGVRTSKEAAEQAKKRGLL